MGCNCKNKKQTKEELIKPANIMTEESAVTYTHDEINLMYDLSKTNWNSDVMSRSKIYTFVNTHFGEAVQGYCDQVCQKRVEEKIEKAKLYMDELKSLQNADTKN